MKTTGKYTLRYEGIDGKLTHRFTQLAALQAAVKAQWEGTDYIDGLEEFHNDYGHFYIGGATLYDLGRRDGKPGTDEWFDWTWKEIA